MLSEIIYVLAASRLTFYYSNNWPLCWNNYSYVSDSGRVFLVGGGKRVWVKISATMVSHRRETLRLYWLKHPKIVPEKNLDQEINDSKPYIWSLSVKFRFSGRKSQSQQKLARKITHFTIQFRSKFITHFTKLSSLSIIKMYSRNTAKDLTLQIFQRTCFWLVSEKTFARHQL